MKRQGSVGATEKHDYSIWRPVPVPNLEYTGPIKEVIEMKPTKLAEKISNAAKVIQGFATDMASSAIEEIPVVGSVLSTLFGHIVDAYGGGGLDPEDVYNSLKTEIDQLKKYMDQEIVEAKLDYIKKAFGTSHGGILSYAKPWWNSELCNALRENVPR